MTQKPDHNNAESNDGDGTTYTMTVVNLKIDTPLFRKAAKNLKAVAHPLRQRILNHVHENKETIVTDLYKKLGLEQSVASQHLKWLREAGVVTTRRNGKQINYSVNHRRLAELETLAKEITK